MVLQLQSMNSAKGPPPDESDGEHEHDGDELHQSEAGKRNGVKVHMDESADESQTDKFANCARKMKLFFFLESCVEDLPCAQQN